MQTANMSPMIESLFERSIWNPLSDELKDAAVGPASMRVSVFMAHFVQLLPTERTSPVWMTRTTFGTAGEALFSSDFSGFEGRRSRGRPST